MILGIKYETIFIDLRKQGLLVVIKDTVSNKS